MTLPRILCSGLVAVSVFSIVTHQLSAKSIIELNTALPRVSQRVQTYTFVSGKPIVDMATLERVFGMEGETKYEDDLGGVLHAIDGDRHGYVFDLGGADYDDISAIDSSDVFLSSHNDALWAKADSIMQSLGIANGAGPAKLTKGTTGETILELRDDQGNITDQETTHLTLYYDQTINDLPTFGPGAQASLTFTANDDVADFSHPLRSLTTLKKVAIQTPKQALTRFEKRVKNKESWNLLRNGYSTVTSLRVDDVSLGYYLPENSIGISTLEPVYGITGTATGLQGNGESDVFSFVWYEPAIKNGSLIRR